MRGGRAATPATLEETQALHFMSRTSVKVSLNLDRNDLKRNNTTE
jgi:hypothetical protein